MNIRKNKTDPVKYFELIYFSVSNVEINGSSCIWKLEN